MGAYACVLVLLLAGWSFLESGVSWAYIGAAGLFEAWLAQRMVSVGRRPVQPEAPPYAFSEEEAQLVGRYRFYFTWPGIARQSSSVLAALGLSALLLVPWLTYQGAFVQAALIGMNLFLVARFTRQLSPVMALRIRARSGDREALSLLGAHDPAWKKIRDAVL
jgi:hypothetical protein